MASVPTHIGNYPEEAPTNILEDGYELWLRYRALEPGYRATCSSLLRLVVLPGGNESPTLAAVRDELMRGLGGMVGGAPEVVHTITGEGVLCVGTPATLPLVASLGLRLDCLGNEGYVIRRVEVNGFIATVIASNDEIGLLYGAFGLLRALQTGEFNVAFSLESVPKITHRLLNHWDNLDGWVERGYAGRSIFNWWELPEYVDPRLTDYARANASVGINGVVLNNVNASSDSLTVPFLEKTAALANQFRPYGLRVYLSAKFSAPMEIGGLTTADPCADEVKAWWNQMAVRIYSRIPDFGGFLVKANSEGQPGPQDYNRTHADGANMLADAIAPWGGVVIWRAFVYSDHVPHDRVTQAYTEMAPLDGRFHNNVILQVKNGPLDFQPREPINPLFGAMPHTNIGVEFQITKEYLGFQTHLVYLGSLWQEVLTTDTGALGHGSTVARVVDGSLFGTPLSMVAGVANVGSARNWCGSTFDQANWFAFGRLAWNPDHDAGDIAREWVMLTLTTANDAVDIITGIMLRSHETAVDYMVPLGLTHQMGTGHHYGPGPWINDAGRADWNPTYYSCADRTGIGFDRTCAGSGAAMQYSHELAQRYSKVHEVPSNLLLWFHHLPWGFIMPSGRTLWEELVEHYTYGVASVETIRLEWAALRDEIDPARFYQVSAYLEIQLKDAQLWRDSCITYFQKLNGMALPQGVTPPSHSLKYYKSLAFRHAPGNPG